MFKQPRTLKIAIEQTIEMHQAVIDGKYKEYVTVKVDMNANKCPLCEYAIYRKSRSINANKYLGLCAYCPWQKIQKHTSCNITYGLNYHNSVQSIERLNSWLNDKKYKP